MLYSQNVTSSLLAFGIKGGYVKCLLKSCCCCYCLVPKSCLTLFETPWTVAHQSSLSMRFPRQEYSMGHHFFLQGIFLTQGSNPCLLQVSYIAGRFFTAEPPGKPIFSMFVGFPQIINPTFQSKGQKCAFLDSLAAKI